MQAREAERKSLPRCGLGYLRSLPKEPVQDGMSFMFD